MYLLFEIVSQKSVFFTRLDDFQKLRTIVNLKYVIDKKKDRSVIKSVIAFFIAKISLSV